MIAEDFGHLLMLYHEKVMFVNVLKFELWKLFKKK